MEFINTTRNAVNLDDIKKVIPFLGETVTQEISADDINRSKAFQYFCINGKFLITSASDERIEQNMYRLQNVRFPQDVEAIPVTVEGQFLNNTGYSKANRNLVYSLAASGTVKVGAVITGGAFDDALPQSEIENISRFGVGQKANIHIVSCIPSFAERPKCKYAILNTTIEASSIPYDFTTACEEFDEIWVVSDFCKKVLTDYGVTKPIIVIPNSINPSLYNTKIQPHAFEPKLNSFVFVCVGTWDYRKGQDILLRAYLEEFTSDDDVTLLFVTPYSGSKQDKAGKAILSAIEGKDRHAHVARCGRSLPEYEMPMLYSACDAFILTSRGEGFGMPYLEAGACGLPVISTRHSGQLMFLNDDNSYLVDHDGLMEVPIGSTDIHYWDGQLFASINSEGFVQRLRKIMRYVFENKEDREKRAIKLSETAKNYFIPVVGKIAAERIDFIWKKHFTF